MEILLSVDAENKYYTGELTYEDLRNELKNNGFETISDEHGEITCLQFENKTLDTLVLREDKEFNVYIIISFK